MNIRAKLASALAVNMLFWMLMLLATAGVLALVSALYLTIEPQIGAPGAIAASGAALLFIVLMLSLGFFGTVQSSAHEPSSAAADQSPEPESLDAQIRPIIGDRAADWARDNTGSAMMAALAAGIVVSASPSLRGTLLRVVEPPLRRQAARIIKRYTDRE